MDKRSILFVVFLTASLFFVNQWFNHKDQERKAVTPSSKPIENTAIPELSQSASTPILPKESSQQFYVLENEYQQIVFSNIGGAIAEINLPFQSSTNEKSIVLPIEFDREMQEDHPANDYFPRSSYWTSLDGKIQKIEQGRLGGYYPLLRRNVVADSQNILYSFSPRYYAFNVISDDENVHMQVYEVTRFEKNLIQFQASDANRKITKTYRLSDINQNTPYCFELDIQVEGDARGLWLSTGIPEVELISGNFSPTLKYLLMRNQKAQVEQVSLPKASTTYSSIAPNWISNSNGFLGLIVQPLSDGGTGFKTNAVPGRQAPTRLTLIDSAYDLYPVDKYPGYEFIMPLRTTGSPLKMRVFAGPYEDDIFQTIDATVSAQSENPNFISALSFQGWFTFISEPFAKFLFILMKFFYKISHSWGFSIILLTIALRIMLYPLNGWSIKSSIRMQQIAPQVTAIQEKYKKDPKRAQMEIVGLYREKGVNPLTGCLPILIQIPFLIGMFDLLKSAFELRGVSFIPGWIDNLTSLHLLPIILGAVMYAQQKFASPLPKDKKMLTDQQKQQKMMGNVMVIVFTVMFYHFPSGLNIYWLSSMALGILQQWMMNKKLKGQPVVVKTK
jgi:YidC/Oxa1 family membrane protein insertase